MPLTSKGEEIRGAMQEEYGAKRGEEVFYASRNVGTITGVDAMAEKEDQPKYNAEAVQKEINKDPRIKGKEAKAIHGLLRGRDDLPEAHMGGSALPPAVTAGEVAAANRKFWENQS